MKRTKIFELNSDKDLVTSVRKGSIEAFDILFLKYHEKLYRFSKSFLKSHEQSQEVIQDVFIRLWENRAQLNPENSFNSYIFTVTKNNVLNVIRKKVYERKYLESLSVKQVLHSFATEDEIDLKELIEVSQEAIDALPPKRKQIFVMSREQGMSYEEIAYHLGISKKTVKNQMTRTLKTLKNRLQGYTEISLSLALFLVLG